MKGASIPAVFPHRLTPKVRAAHLLLLKLIDYIRKQNGLSQKDLGRLLNLPDTTISAYELNKISPDFETILKIVRFFDYDLCILDENKNVFSIEQFMAENE